NLRFSYNLNKKIEFILYENSISSEGYKLAEIENVANLNFIEEIMNNLQYASRKSSIKDFYSSNTNISENKIKLYSKLFEVDTPTNKIKIFELLNLQNKNLEIKYYDEKFGCTVPLKNLKKLAQSEMGSEVKSEENGERQSWERASMGVITSAEMHEEPTPLLKQDSNDKVGDKKIKTKDFLFQTEEHNKGTAININE
ncbi:hypothetical protein CWI39_0574p0010, partial [Hamiltosporidium magnivora]